MKRLAIIGAGWAGLSAAMAATEAGWAVTLFEAARTPGGRARSLPARLPDGRSVQLDNGQHILIGAYTQTLRLMRQAGVAPEQALLDRPMALRFPDGGGLALPDWPTRLDRLATLYGLVAARGWSARDKASLVRAVWRWQRQGWSCAPDHSVRALCRGLSARLQAELVEPLCVSALNTPADDASAAVFLRVLGDALFGPPGGSRLLLPRVDLGQVFPEAALRWLSARGVRVHLGQRAAPRWSGPAGAQPGPLASAAPGCWQVNGTACDAVLLATSASNALETLDPSGLIAPENIANSVAAWCRITSGLRFEAIATVYAWAPRARLPRPMLALRPAGPGGAAAPAQFAFDRGQLGGPGGLLAFVVSACRADRAVLERQTLEQARDQLGLALQSVRTLVDKRATFACTPGLQRPPPAIAHGLWACGDYLQGPYPATLEGAVRSGLQSVQALVRDGAAGTGPAARPPWHGGPAHGPSPAARG